MKRLMGSSAPALALVIFVISALEAAGQAERKTNTLTPQSESMTLWQARRAVLNGFYVWGYTFDHRSYVFTLDAFEFDVTNDKSHRREHIRIDLKNLEPVFAKRKGFGYANLHVLKDEAAKDLPFPLNKMGFDGFGAAEQIATALNCLRSFAGSAGKPLRTFTQQAAAWRALPSKLPIPEEVRATRLLAENAVKEKKPEEALIQYETGLELYPVWPEGRFNAALIASELGFYAEAVEHMQAYLELVPDAQDAQAARDQIAIWQYKEKGTK